LTHRLRVALAVALILAISPLSSLAAEYGTSEEAIAMVKRVQAKVKKDGLEATFKAITEGAKEFRDRDLYPYMLDFDGNDPAHGGVPSLVGKNLLDLKDQDGKWITRDIIVIAKEKGSGWYDYRWPNPITKTVEDKSTYIERVGERHIVAVGIYKNEQPNENTVGLISGSPSSDDTYLQMAYDLAEVLNDGSNLRILPIAGVGGPRNIRDVRYLKGIDIGLTQTSILNSFRRSNERMGQTDNRIVYIAKLFNEEVHLVARPDITSIDQLKGLKVNLDAKGSGTSYSMRDIFKTLGIEVVEVSMSQIEGLEKVRSGEIAATAVIAGKPVRSMSRLGPADGLHFVPLPYPGSLIADYFPATLTHEDYPGLIPAGESVDTVAVGAVLIACNWPKSNWDRYHRVQRFVEAFFPKLGEFQKPPRHPKWREVNLAATLPGWTRFEVAQAWLDANRSVTQTAGQRPQDLRQTATARPPARAVSGAGIDTKPDPKDSTALYQEFLRWQQTHSR
jgi:uncharacterized protein